MNKVANATSSGEAVALNQVAIANKNFLGSGTNYNIEISIKLIQNSIIYVDSYIKNSKNVDKEEKDYLLGLKEEYKEEIAELKEKYPEYFL